MPHRDAKLDYGNPADVEGARAPTRSANERRTDSALEMAIQGASPLSGRIQVMEPFAGFGTGTVITTKKFVDFARSWFKDPKISGRNFDRVFICFRRYLFAWDLDVNETSTEEAWDSRQNGVEDPYITRKFPFESVMGLFPLVWKFALEKADVPRIDDFSLPSSNPFSH